MGARRYVTRDHVVSRRLLAGHLRDEATSQFLPAAKEAGGSFPLVGLAARCLTLKYRAIAGESSQRRASIRSYIQLKQ